MRGKENTDLPIAAAPLTPERAQAVFESRSGIAVAEMSAREAREAGYETRKPVLAIKLVERGSQAARLGLRHGDLILAINSAEVESLKDFRKALAQARKSGRAVLLVQRGYRLQEFEFDAG